MLASAFRVAARSLCFAAGLICTSAWSAAFSETVLHSFDGASGGGYPEGHLIQGADGNFYGTTSRGGLYDDGTIYKIAADGTWTKLYDFDGVTGVRPYFNLLQNTDGNFYGTTYYGGTHGDGVIFKITPDGALTKLYDFTGGSDGSNPAGGLVIGSDGGFYGTSFGGGSAPYGTVFRLGSDGSFTTLYRFAGAADGCFPGAGLTAGGDGYFYGTTGSCGANRYGTIFRISAAGDFTPLYAFDTGGSANALTLGSDGNLYGTTQHGGAHDLGQIFRITRDGAFSVLYSFDNDANGNLPADTLLQGTDGNLYGTASLGGANGNGTAYRISPQGTFAVIYSFQGSPDGTGPSAGLVEGKDGDLYGTTYNGGHPPVSSGSNYGTVYKLAPPAPLPHLTLVSSPSSAGVGQTITLYWYSSGVTSCTASDGWAGAKAVSGSEAVTVAHTGNNSYTLACTGPGGTATQTTTVGGFPAPLVQIYVHPTQAGVGQSVLLEWSSSYADTCMASGDWSGTKSTFGSETVVVARAGGNYYSLTCSGFTGSTTQSVVVTGLPPPQLTFTAEPVSLFIDQSTTLKWSTTDAYSCNASGDWSGGNNVSGSAQVINYTVGTRHYTLTCTGHGGSVSKSVAVTWKVPSVGFVSAAERTSRGSLAGQTSTSIEVRLSSAVPFNVSVPFTLSGTDPAERYTVSPANVLIIPAGSTSGSIVVDVKYPAWLQCDRTVALALGSPRNATLGAITTNTLTVHNYSPVVVCVSLGR